MKVIDLERGRRNKSDMVVDMGEENRQRWEAVATRDGAVHQSFNCHDFCGMVVAWPG